MNFYNKLFILLLSGVMLCTSLNAAATTQLSYSGKDFWVAFQQIMTLRSNFYISGPENATITLQFFSLGTTRTVSFTGGTVLAISLTDLEAASIAFGASEVVASRSLHITSSKAVTIEFLTYESVNDDGTIIFPSDNYQYSDEFYLNGPKIPGSVPPLPGERPGALCTFVMVCRQDNTLVEITPSKTMHTHAAGIPFDVLLNRGSTYVLSPADTGHDLSGTKIRVKSTTKCNPINIFLSYDATTVNGRCCADIMIQQMLPVSAWDTLYAMVPFANNPYNPIKIVSASNNNNVYFDGHLARTLNAGQFYDTVISRPVIVNSSAPLGILQVMLSQNAAHSNPVPVDFYSDPAILHILSLRDGFNDGYFRTASNIPTLYTNIYLDLPDGYRFNGLNMITATDNAPTVMLDNINIGARFRPFPGNTAYSYYINRPDTNGYHHITSKGKILANYYGANSGPGAASYAIGGTLTPERDTFLVCTNDSITLIPEVAMSYAWSNGRTTRSITVRAQDTGLYTVKMEKSCEVTESREYYVQEQKYDQRIQSDTIHKCLHETVTMLANPQAKYEWYDGSTSPQKQTSEWNKTFFVKETYQSQCAVTTHNFTVVPSKPTQIPIDLGHDTTLCIGDIIVLNSENNSTHWSDGTIGRQFIVDIPGVYWAYQFDPCLETTTADTIKVTDCMDLYCTLVFPSAFTPNGDGRNDVFKPVMYGTFTDYLLVIYNRWGQEVYRSYKAGEAWNGQNKNGTPMDLGTYYYLCTYTCKLNGKQKAKGELTLIR